MDFPAPLPRSFDFKSFFPRALGVPLQATPGYCITFFLENDSGYDRETKVCKSSAV